MTDTAKIFQQISASLPGTTQGKMFGALCIKAPNGKAGVIFSKRGEMVFKLRGEELHEALALDGARNFDPSGGRPMKEWVEIPAAHADKWERFAKEAMEFAGSL